MTGPAPQSGGFQVDRAAASQAIRELEQAAAELEDIKKEAAALKNVRPPSNDEVSRDAALALGAVAGDGPGSFINAAQLGIDRITEVIAALQASLDGYGAADTAAADSLR